MTNYWKELSNKRINAFNEFLSKNKITQTEASILLGISKGQLSHLLKGDRSLNNFIFNRMGYIIDGKLPQETGGIYGIYYDNQLIYIGRTNNFETRFKTHISNIKNNHNDTCPFHQSNLDVSHLSYKIIIDCNNKPLYIKELSRIEELIIRAVLPEWNTDIASLSNKHCSNEDKINQLVELHDTHLSLLNKEINEYELPITEIGEQILLAANEYSKDEITKKASIIFSHAAIRPIMEV